MKKNFIRFHLRDSVGRGEFAVAMKLLKSLP